MTPRRPVLAWIGAAVGAAGWAPLGVLWAHIVASRALGLYLVFPGLDMPMHLAGGAAMGYFFWTSLAVEPARPVLGTLSATAAALLSLAATGTSTLVWELAEWLSDRCLGTHMQRGLEDTLLDMSLGLLGGLALVATVAARPGRRPMPGRAE